MKENKGFTLVELLAALAVMAILMSEVVQLMANCATLYRSGTSEVNLQGEAQRVIQISEELIMDANVSVDVVSGDETTGNGYTIVVKNKIVSDNDADVEYRIRLDKEAGAEYGNLYLVKTVNGATQAEQLLAEYVASIDLDKSPEKYKKDIVTLSIEMQNKNHGYKIKEIKDIYLRNTIGSGGGAVPNEVEKGNYTLTALRYETYDLYKVIGESNSKNADGHKYEFKAKDKENLYVCSGSNISTGSSLNNNWHKSGGCNVDIIDPDSKEIVGSIEVKTEIVKVGLVELKENGSGTYCNGANPWYFHNESTSYVLHTYVQVKGVSLFPDDGFSGVSTYFGSHNAPVKYNPSSFSETKTNTTFTLYDSTSDKDAGAGTRREITLQNMGYSLDKETNSIVLHAGQGQIQSHGSISMKYSDLLAYCKNPIVGNITLNYNQGGRVSVNGFVLCNGEQNDIVGTPSTFWDNWDLSKMGDPSEYLDDDNKPEEIDPPGDESGDDEPGDDEPGDDGPGDDGPGDDGPGDDGPGDDGPSDPTE